MMKKLGLVFAAGVLMTTLGGGAASALPQGPPEHASGPPIGGCPAGAADWMLVQPSGPEHLSAQYDFNRDGYVCARWLPAFDGQSAIAFKDNVRR